MSKQLNIKIYSFFINKYTYRKNQDFKPEFDHKKKIYDEL